MNRVSVAGGNTRSPRAFGSVTWRMIGMMRWERAKWELSDARYTVDRGKYAEDRSAQIAYIGIKNSEKIEVM